MRQRNTFRKTAFPMRGAVLLVAVFFVSGCQFLDLSPSFDEADGHELARLEALLDGEHWLPRQEWSPQWEWENRVTGRPTDICLRWGFASTKWHEELGIWKADSENHGGEFRTNLCRLEKLSRQDNLAGWNAAILWARLEPANAQAVLDVLERLATKPTSDRVDLGPEEKSRNRQIRLATQAAAAEAWCLVLSTTHEDPVEALAPAGRALAEGELPIEVRAELYRGIGRWVPPANVPGLDASLKPMQVSGVSANPPLLRQAAMDACVLFAIWNGGQEELNAEDVWPKTLDDWQWEPDAYFEDDPIMRKRFANWLVLLQHPNAETILESQLADGDLGVRDEALINLGRLKTPAAKSLLIRQARRPAPHVRAMAAKGLAHWGPRALTPYLEDSSFEVRVSVAEELGRFPTADSAVWLRDLIADSNRQVEITALQATDSWPNSLAVPLLLHGMEHGSMAARRNCFRELRRRTGITDSFPIKDGPEARRRSIAQIIKRWNLPSQLASHHPPANETAKINELRVEELQGYLLDLTNPELPAGSIRRQTARNALAESSSEDVPAIEAFLETTPPSQRPVEILDFVLPRISAVYQALTRLKSANTGQRQIAASELRRLAQQKSLSRFVTHQLEEHLNSETDALVWQFSIEAVLPDDNPAVLSLMRKAANHPSAGIRRLACEFADRHRRAEFADWLLPMLHDADRDVQRAAIQAAGQCGNRLVIDGIPSSRPEESLPGLRSLLADRDALVAMDAAIAMSLLGDPAGHDELIRLSHHSDPQVRIAVVTAMGTSGQTRFVEKLIGIGWTTRDAPIQKAVLGSLEQLVPAENRPVDLAGAKSQADKIRLWAEWLADRQNLGEFS